MSIISAAEMQDTLVVQYNNGSGTDAGGHAKSLATLVSLSALVVPTGTVQRAYAGQAGIYQSHSAYVDYTAFTTAYNAKLVTLSVSRLELWATVNGKSFMVTGVDNLGGLDDTTRLRLAETV